MAFPQSIWKIYKQEILNLYSLFIIMLISLLYFSASIFLLNYKLIQSSILGEISISFKFKILFELLVGYYTALSSFDFLLLVITSLLVGFNILIVYKTLIKLKNFGGKLSLTAGGSAILGIFVVGCSSCGFSVLSLLGLMGALSFIPFRGLGLQILVILLLVFSFVYSLKTYHKKLFVKLNNLMSS